MRDLPPPAARVRVVRPDLPRERPAPRREPAAALGPLGEYVASIGMDRPLADYSREEVLTLIEVVVTAFQDHLIQAETERPG